MQLSLIPTPHLIPSTTRIPCVWNKWWLLWKQHETTPLPPDSHEIRELICGKMPQPQQACCHNHSRPDATITADLMPQSQQTWCHNHSRPDATITAVPMPQPQQTWCHNHRRPDATITADLLPQPQQACCHNHSSPDATITADLMPHHTGASDMYSCSPSIV